MAGEGRCLARAALAGNPSDGFGGAVLATVVPSLEAVVTVASADRSGPEVPLVRGTRATLHRHGFDVTDADLALSTAIPRSVGLAGSSAIVIATIRALLPARDLPAPLELARLALEVEVEELGIAAGPQDRIVQAEGRTVLMDFATTDWIVSSVDPPRPVDLFVAWTDAAPVPSQQVHGPLRARATDPAVRQAMAQLSELAHAGAHALRAGDLPGLRRAMDRSYDQRAGILDLDGAHVALVEGARAAGASVNYAGSGGAVVGAAPDLAAVEAWATDAGHGFRRWTLGAAAA